jgi:hypothetical protein
LADSTIKADAVLRALRRYCALHPRAADTLEGVRGWLPAELRTRPDSELIGALDALQAAGTITRRRLPDGTVIFFSTGRVNGST